MFVVSFLRRKTTRKRYITGCVEDVKLVHLRTAREFRTYLRDKTGVFRKYLRRKTARKRHITERLKDENRLMKDVFVTFLQRKAS